MNLSIAISSILLVVTIVNECDGALSERKNGLATHKESPIARRTKGTKSEKYEKKEKIKKSEKKEKIKKSEKKGKKGTSKSCNPKLSSKATKRCNKTKGASTPDFILVEDQSALNTSFVPEAVNRCLVALQLSGFSPFDLEQYDKWFDDSSIAVIPDTGYYVGSENIKEYVSIFSEGSTYKLFEDYISDSENQQFLPIVAQGNKCTITLYTKTSSYIAPLNDTIDFVGGTKLHYTILDDGPNPSKILVGQFDAYVPKNMLTLVYTAAKNEDFATRICQIMQDRCPSTFQNNCYTAKSFNNCIDDLLSLPAVGEGGRIDGKSFGCRVNHAFFASTNDSHCPHTSFIPEYDSSCVVKCQDSYGLSNEDVFYPFELSAFAQFGVAIGLGEEQWKLGG